MSSCCPEREVEEDCEYKDIMIRLCYGKYKQPGSRDWFEKSFWKEFERVEKYMPWPGNRHGLGERNVVVALVLYELA